MRQSPKCHDWAKAVKTKAEAVRVSYKNTHETAACLKGMSLDRAKRFLKNVIRKREIVPFRRHTGYVENHYIIC